LPIFVIGFDFGRWIFNWMSVSTLSYGLIRQLIDPSAMRSDLAWQPNRLFQGLTRFAASRLPAIPLSEIAFLFVLMLMSIPRCCWSLKTYVITTPPYYGLFLMKRYFVALFHWGDLPQNFSYPLY